MRRKLNIDQAVGQVLREARKRKGLTQEALAWEAGADRSYVSLIELGRNSPSVRKLLLLCEALDLPASEFMLQVESLIAVKTVG